jgi:hypothetical protein
MKSNKIPQKAIQTRRVAPVQKRQTQSSTGEPRNPLLDGLSGFALIEALRGSLPGKPSLVAALQRERRKDDRANTRKLMARDREIKARMLESR